MRHSLVIADHTHAHDDHNHGFIHDHGECPRSHAYGHSHGLVDPSIVRSRDGVKTVAISLGILAVTAALQL
jgi:hypothetical protein